MAYYLSIVEHVHVERVLFITLIKHSHFVLFEHFTDTGFVRCHNSLGAMHPVVDGSVEFNPYDNYDIRAQQIIVTFICRRLRRRGLPQV